MKVSTMCQVILEEGRADEARKFVLLLGGQRFGEPSGQVRNEIESIDSVDRLERMVERLLSVFDWNDLLASA